MATVMLQDDSSVTPPCSPTCACTAPECSKFFEIRARAGRRLFSFRRFTTRTPKCPTEACRHQAPASRNDHAEKEYSPALRLQHVRWHGCWRFRCPPPLSVCIHQPDSTGNRSRLRQNDIRGTWYRFTMPERRRMMPLPEAHATAHNSEYATCPADDQGRQGRHTAVVGVPHHAAHAAQQGRESSRRGVYQLVWSGCVV